MRLRSTVLGLALALVAALPGSAPAGEAKGEGRAEAKGEAKREAEREVEREVEPEAEPLARRISVEFKETAFTKCIDELARKSGVNVVASQEVIKKRGKDPVTFAARDIPIWGLIHLFARSCRLEVSHEDGAFLFEEQVKPNEVWARVEIEIDGAEMEITILRADVPARLRRHFVHRALHKHFRGDREEEEEAERRRDEERARRKRRKKRGEGKGPAGKPEKKAKPAPKGEMF
jgi:hypothetical protein